MEELVGEIYDEHDEVINHFKPISETTTLIDGNADLSDMFEYYGIERDQEDFEASTVSGWVIEILGEIPHAGKKLEYKNLDVEVLKSTVKKVLQVKVTLVDRPEEENTEDE